jgi:hypothetical protein
MYEFASPALRHVPEIEIETQKLIRLTKTTGISTQSDKCRACLQQPSQIHLLMAVPLNHGKKVLVNFGDITDIKTMPKMCVRNLIFLTD